MEYERIKYITFYYNYTLDIDYILDLIIINILQSACTAQYTCIKLGKFNFLAYVVRFYNLIAIVMLDT